MKIRNSIILFAILVLSLFTSCNWDVLTGEVLEATPGESWETSSSVLFTGSAPRNLRVSRAAYSDRITLSFSTVPNAEFYRIFRAEVPIDFRNDSDANYEGLVWNLIGHVQDNGESSILFSDNDPYLSRSADVAYLYTVQAGNDYAEAFLSTFPEYSSVEKGWLLTPPSTVNADQGASFDYIAITWSEVSEVNRYKVEYSVDRVDWTTITDRYPPVLVDGVNSYYFYPGEALAGTQLYFRVSSVQSSSVSNPSSSRIGYTLVEGAPPAPTGVTVSKAESPDGITIKWDIPNSQNDDINPYTWEITRMAPGEEEKVILKFVGGPVEPAEVIRDGKTYTYTDNDSALRPNVVYEYTLKAYCEVGDEEGDETAPDEEATLYPGPAVKREGYLLSPPADFEYSADYNAKTMNIVVGAPLGFDGSDWLLEVQGRHNDGETQSSWKEIGTFAVEEELSLDFIYDPLASASSRSSVITTDCNEFRFRVDNGTYKSAYTAPIAPDEIKANDFKVVANGVPDDEGSANSSGIYPVVFTSTNEAPGVTIELAVWDSTGKVLYSQDEPYSISSADLVSGNNSLPAEISPDEPFEKYTYQARKINPFGRKTSWGTLQEGWGGLTGAGFIHQFEKWILKPWAYRSELPSNLQSKWDSSNPIVKKVEAAGPSSLGDASVSSEYGGQMKYSVTAFDISGWGTIRFDFTNFGEHDDFSGQGYYIMLKARVSGDGNGVEGNMRVTSTMYPAVVDFSQLNTKDQAFVGNYRVNQNGRGYENVTAP